MYDPNQYFDTGRCPACGSTQVHVQCTKKPYRSLKCDACGLNYKSLSLLIYKQNSFEVLAELYRKKELALYLV